jgi:hypothetical protein
VIKEVRELESFVAETMALVEIWFPPAFFDIMIHLIVHLPRQMAICGPVHNRWMYGTERYMGVLKSMYRSRSKPEASICNGFLKEETMDYLSQYMPGFQPSARKLWFAEEDNKVSGEVLEGRLRSKLADDNEIMQIHEFIFSPHALLSVSKGPMWSFLVPKLEFKFYAERKNSC